MLFEIKKLTNFSVEFSQALISLFVIYVVLSVNIILIIWHFGLVFWTKSIPSPTQKACHCFLLTMELEVCNQIKDFVSS